MYEQRLMRNIRPVIEEHGIEITALNIGLKSISYSQLFNIENGRSSTTVRLLEAVADEIGADFLEFFRE